MVLGGHAGPIAIDIVVGIAGLSPVNWGESASGGRKRRHHIRRAVMDHVGEWVKVRGSLFSRGALDVMNTRKATPMLPPSGTPEADASGSSEGEFSLRGEIMDSKCFSGVMKPGSGKTHMGCAIRCISGGVPAVFHVRRNSGATLDFVLIDDQSRAVNERVLPLVAQPLELKGEVVRFDNLLALKANPDSYRSLKE